jgi:hypothetical protein
VSETRTSGSPTAPELTADLIRRRDDMRLVLGLLYEEQVQPARALLVKFERKYPGKNIAQIALEMAQRVSAAGHNPNLIFCALVDECEERSAAKR